MHDRAIYATNLKASLTRGFFLSVKQEPIPPAILPHKRHHFSCGAVRFNEVKVEHEELDDESQ